MIKIAKKGGIKAVQFLMKSEFARRIVYKIEGERIKYLNRSVEKRFPDRLPHILQVSSYGGCGTTMLYDFLSNKKAGVPDDYKDWYLRHTKKPPKEERVMNGFRCIYLYSDPFNSLISIFRRGYQNEIYRRLGNGKKKEWNLKEYLRNGEDVFLFKKTYKNWTESVRKYPILILKYETMWEYLPEIMAFVGLPKKAADDFPEKRPRSSDWRSKPDVIREQLKSIYGDLRAEIQEAPEFRIV
jgi:hypothetical protein